MTKLYTHDWRHISRGSTYRVAFVTEANFEMNEGDDFIWQDENDYTQYASFQGHVDRFMPIIIYYNIEDGYLWSRSLAEFTDGRFEAIPKP